MNFFCRSTRCLSPGCHPEDLSSTAGAPRSYSSSLLLSSLSWVIQKSLSLRYEPSSEPLHNSVKQLFLNLGSTSLRVSTSPSPPKRTVNNKCKALICGVVGCKCVVRRERPPPTHTQTRTHTHTFLSFSLALSFSRARARSLSLSLACLSSLSLSSPGTRQVFVRGDYLEGRVSVGEMAYDLHAVPHPPISSSSVSLHFSLESSDMRVCEPSIRAPLGTASHFLFLTQELQVDGFVLQAQDVNLRIVRLLC